MRLAPLVLFTVLTLNACMYTHVTVPLSTEVNKTEVGEKQGRSSMYSLFWLFAWGDSGAAKAAKKGGIGMLTHMDREFQSILFGIYTRTTTVAYGN